MFNLFSDEKERYDPIGFRDAVICGLDKCTNDFEAISRYLHGAGNKLDYRRYGECLFDILIAGGILVPGGTLSQEGDGPPKTEVCIFCTPDEIDIQLMKNWEQVFTNLMRRFKYLEKIFQVMHAFQIILRSLFCLLASFILFPQNTTFNF